MNADDRTCQKILQHRERMERLKKKYTFDSVRAGNAIRFIEKNLRHWKAPFAGQPFVLSDWQKRDIIEPLYGIVKSDGTRLFREAYIQLGRKNGKTALASAIGTLELALGGEGSEVYSAATSAEQAKIVFNDMAAFIKRSPQLKKRMHTKVASIEYPAKSSIFRYLSSEHNTLDGLSVSAAIVDELHQHPSSALWDVISSATMARSEPLVLGITTAGSNRNSFCYQKYELASQILDGSICSDGLDHLFCYIAEKDESTDWDSDLALWQANPNLGISCSLSDLQAKRELARVQKSQFLAFMRYHLNCWTAGDSNSWISEQQWQSCYEEIDEATLQGLPCFGALDLARSIDINSFCLLFVLPDGKLYCKFWHWMPQDTVQERSSQDRVPYTEWAAAGLIKLTAGNTVDQTVISDDIKQLCDRFKPSTVAFDSWNALWIQQDLRSYGVPMVEFVQGMRTLHPCTQETERLISTQSLLHGKNPCVSWMMTNALLQTDISGKIRPVKASHSSTKRIDSVITCVMAVDMWMRSSMPSEPKQEPLDFAAILASGLGNAFH